MNLGRDFSPVAEDDHPFTVLGALPGAVGTSSEGGEGAAQLSVQASGVRRGVPGRSPANPSLTRPPGAAVGLGHLSSGCARLQEPQGELRSTRVRPTRAV